MSKLHIKKGDTVYVNAGEDKGKTGRVLKVLVKEGRAFVEGINMVSTEITNHVLWPTELKRQVGKLAISRRYNQLPLLRSSPGGFEGSWPYGTYPCYVCIRDSSSMFLDCGCKGTHIF